MGYWNSPSVAQAPTNPYKDEYTIISGNSVMAISSPINSPKIGSLGALYDENDIQDLIRENTLISCLIEKESNWNIEAKGNDGEIGILQFKPETFYAFSRRYSLELSIYEPEHQILLAQKMIIDGYLYLWSTAKLCPSD